MNPLWTVHMYPFITRKDEEAELLEADILDLVYSDSRNPWTCSCGRYNVDVEKCQRCGADVRSRLRNASFCLQAPMPLGTLLAETSPEFDLDVRHFRDVLSDPTDPRCGVSVARFQHCTILTRSLPVMVRMWGLDEGAVVFCKLACSGTLWFTENAFSYDGEWDK